MSNGLFLDCLLAIITFTVSAQDLPHADRPEQSISVNPKSRQPKVIRLGKLPENDLRSNRLQIDLQEEITLQNLEKYSLGNPATLRIQSTLSKVSWPEPKPVEFQKFRERSSTNISKLDSDQGLASDQILDMAQDSLGNWWFASGENGLIYYDGRQQRVFDSKNGLSSDNINVLLIDHQQRIWIGSNQGVDIFDGFQVRKLNTANGFPDNMIWLLYEDHEQNVWVGTESGLIKINPEANSYEYYSTANGLPGDLIFSVFQDSQNSIWVGTDAGLAILETQGDDTTIMTVKVTNGLPSETIWSIAEDLKGNIWLGSNGHGIYQWPTSGNRIRVFNSENGLTSNWIWNIYAARDGSLYFGTYGEGVVRYQNTPELGEVFSKYDVSEGLTNNYAYKITEDQAGTIWIGTDGGGLNFLQHSRSIIKNYSEHTGLNDKFVQSIFRDSEGWLWMGTAGRGVNIIDEQNQKVTYLNEKNGLSYNSVWAITEDAIGKIWIGTEQGLNVYDKSNHTLMIYDTLSGLSGMVPWTLKRDRSGKIWVGTNDGGLCKYDPESQSFKAYDSFGLGTMPIMGFAEDESGAMWVGTRGAGLFKIWNDEHGEHIQPYNHASGLSSDSITYLFRDSRGWMWAGTEGFGVHYFQSTQDNPVFQRMSSDQGLSNDDVWSIIEDDEGRIWVGTVNKISIFHINEEQPQLIGYLSANEGLRSNDLNPSSVWKESDGKLIWATIKGPSVVDPSLFQPKPKDVRVLITGLELQNQFVDFRNQGYIVVKGEQVKFDFDTTSFNLFQNAPSGIRLPHEIYAIQVNFIGQGALEQRDLQFQYVLKGLSDSWTNTQTPTSVVLNNLQPGRYNLLIRARTLDGNWGTPTSFEFQIATPWWETWWARIAGMVFLASMLYSFYVLRTRSLVRSKALLEEKVRQRTSELEKSLREVVEARKQLVHSERMASLGMLSSGIAHELNNPISAVYNATQLIKRDLEDSWEPNGNEKEARETVRMSLNVLEVASNQTREIVKGLTNYSRIESKEMILGDVHQCLDNSIMLVQSKLGEVAIEKDYHQDIPLIKCYYTELTQVFLNLISNAIDAIQDRQTGEGLIRITTDMDEHFAKISVTDNGTGMSLETSKSVFKSFFTSKEPGRGTGLGLAISQSIVEKHHGSIRFETEKGVGTTFTTLLPLEE